ncbi:DNA repair protein RecO [Robertkochia solimangrovi]|uniref:DNA repair protein RecO n=1 Tax=Robertkochia solimangrovi TaxID=2213046 RepID=UPI00118117E3|nr:DNA repair protein RecO [Robertkochia solimangrovi]TRZ45853.1 DNA repair protein RecO [Robertkochia solimangrovi]
MLVKTNAIVLSVIKYGESSLIARLLTENYGLRSYMLKGVRSPGKKKIRPGYFQPFTQLEVVASHKDKGSLETLREVRLAHHYQSLQTDIVKSSLVMFLAEVVQYGVQETDDDPDLYDFIIRAADWLDENEDMASFHIVFMLHLTRFLGFYPDFSNEGAPVFDLVEGELVENTLNPSASGDLLDILSSLMEAGFENMSSVRMNRGQRVRMLNMLVEYYQIHLHGFRKPKSLDILQSVFH